MHSDGIVGCQLAHYFHKPCFKKPEWISVPMHLYVGLRYDMVQCCATCVKRTTQQKVSTIRHTEGEEKNGLFFSLWFLFTNLIHTIIVDGSSRGNSSRRKRSTSPNASSSLANTFCCFCFTHIYISHAISHSAFWYTMIHNNAIQKENVHEIKHIM